MGDVVAILAFGEFGHHARRMRSAVAILAFGQHLVFVLVARYAQKLAMLGFACREVGHRVLVAGSATLVGEG